MSSLSKRQPPKIIKVQKRCVQARNHPVKTYNNTNIVLDELQNRLLCDPNFSEITNDQLIDLQKLCDRKIKEHIRDHMYIEARKYQQLSQRISEEATKRIENPLFAPTENVFPTNRSNQSPRDQAKYKIFDDETSTMVDQLQTKHQRLMECFEDIWQTKIQPKYFIESSRLTHLKSKFGEAVAHGDSDRAGIISSQIEQLEQKEEQINSDAFQKDYRQAKDALEAKQSAQLTNLLALRQKQRCQLVKRFNSTEPKPMATRSLKLAQKPAPAVSRTIVIPKRQSTSQLSQLNVKKENHQPTSLEEIKTSEIGIQADDFENDDSMFEDPNYAINEENRKRIEEQNRELTDGELDEFGDNVVLNLFEDSFTFLAEINIEPKQKAGLSLGSQSEFCDAQSDKSTKDIPFDFIENSDLEIDFNCKCESFVDSYVINFANNAIDRIYFTNKREKVGKQMNSLLEGLINDNETSSESGE